LNAAAEHGCPSGRHGLLFQPDGTGGLTSEQITRAGKLIDEGQARQYVADIL
jgi:hypothetical protein